MAANNNKKSGNKTNEKNSKEWQKRKKNVEATQQQREEWKNPQKSREKPTENNLLHCFMNTMPINTNERYVCEAANQAKRIIYMTLFGDGFSLIFPCVSIFHATLTLGGADSFNSMWAPLTRSMLVDTRLCQEAISIAWFSHFVVGAVSSDSRSSYHDYKQIMQIMRHNRVFLFIYFFVKLC